MFYKKVKVGFKKYIFKHKMKAVFLHENLFGKVGSDTIGSYRMAYCILLVNNKRFEKTYPNFDRFMKVVEKQPTFIVEIIEALGGNIEKKMKAQIQELTQNKLSQKKTKTH